MNWQEQYEKREAVVKEQFLDKYPRLFSSNFDFSLGEGWYPLLHSLCSDLDAILQESKEELNFSVTQVKEKFAGLRFYVAGVPLILCDC